MQHQCTQHLGCGRASGQPALQLLLFCMLLGCTPTSGTTTPRLSSGISTCTRLCASSRCGCGRACTHTISLPRMPSLGRSGAIAAGGRILPCWCSGWRGDCALGVAGWGQVTSCGRRRRVI
eukprot:1159511-Pelagomonas_calceolata.AAC.6